MTRALFGYSGVDEDLPNRAGGVPALSWREAYRTAHVAMKAEAAKHDLVILSERRMAIDIDKRAYVYRV